LSLTAQSSHHVSPVIATRALRARHYRAEFVALKAADAPPPAVAFGQP
jgi:hypothetical protein